MKKLGARVAIYWGNGGLERAFRSIGEQLQHSFENESLMLDTLKITFEAETDNPLFSYDALLVRVMARD